MRKPVRHAIYAVIFIISVLFGFSSCKIVKHKENADTDSGITFYFENDDFNAASFVQEQWDDKILPEIAENAVPLSSLLPEIRNNREKALKEFGIQKEGSDIFLFIVKGTAIVGEIDRTSSAGIMILEDKDLSGTGHCSIQIGPVIKKSVVRDSLSFIDFGDFTNQIEYANVSREINVYIRDNIVNNVDELYFPGSTVVFMGVFPFNENGAVIITPVMLDAAEGEN